MLIVGKFGFIVAIIMNLPFSYREKHRRLNEDIQIQSMNVDLKNGLWNTLIEYYFNNENKIPSHGYGGPYIEESFYKLIESYWKNILKRPTDEIENDWHSIYDKFKDMFFSMRWYEIYDLLEFFANNNYENSYRGSNKHIQFVGINARFIQKCNYILEREFSGYRFVDSLIVPIINQTEIEEIEQAISVSATSQSHLEKALIGLSDRTSPDYKNSIKESIHAVESVCHKVSDKNTLGDALREIKKTGKVDIHPALENAFQKIYGYTNDAGGIRHAEKIGENHDVDFEDAKFMLVSVSAFINYLKVKIDKAGIKL